MYRVVLVLCASLLCVACVGDEPERVTPRAALAAPQSELPPIVDPRASAPDLPLVGQPVPVPFVREVDWKAAGSGPQLSPDALRADQRAVAERSPVPVLLPDRAALLAVASLHTGPHWFAASMVHDGHDVHIHGTRLAYKVPGHKVHAAGRRALEAGFMVTRNEGYAVLSFKSHGAAYMLQVGCARPSEDTRCTADDYIVALANDLAMVPRGGPR